MLKEVRAWRLEQKAEQNRVKKAEDEIRRKIEGEQYLKRNGISERKMSSRYNKRRTTSY